MWWFKPSFKKKFGQIKGGWSTSQVLGLLGGPMEMEDSEVPLGSDWGSQPGMTFRMKAGDPVKQWMFENKGEFYYLWFAKVSYADDDPWRVTLTKKCPAGYRHKPKTRLGSRFLSRQSKQAEA